MSAPEARSRRFAKLWWNAIAAITFLGGLTLWQLGMRWESTAMEAIGGFAALVLAVHFLYDRFVREIDRQALTEMLEQLIEPQGSKLVALQQAIETLDQHTRTAFNLIRYTNPDFFETRWRDIVERYGQLIILGDCPEQLVEYALGAVARGKRLRIFRTMRQETRDDCEAILRITSDMPPPGVALYHIERFDWGFVAIGTNSDETEADVLINNGPVLGDRTLQGGAASHRGYYMFGETALALLRSISPRISEAGESEEDLLAPVLVNDPDVLNYLLVRRSAYTGEINALARGIPLNGKEEICEKMSMVLGATRSCLRVTHVATPGNIGLMGDDVFRKWLECNYRAAERGVDIERIFLVPKSHVHNSELLATIKQMASVGIRVKYCVLEELDANLREDFSLYDDKRVIYISTGTRGGWLEDRAEEARYSSRADVVRKYRRLFGQLDKRARHFDVISQAHSPAATVRTAEATKS